MRSILALVFVLILGSVAQAATLEGVTLPDTETVAGKSLVLNGIGLRKKGLFKVYVAGLYLPAKETSAEKVLAGDTERKMVLQFVRNVSKDQICNAWHEGLDNNSPAKAKALRPNFDTLCTYMQDLKEGNQLAFAYAPGKGTTISVNGVEKGTIAGKEFADAMFACWIGPNPPGEAFKKALMGG